MVKNLFGELKCFKCGKPIENDERITIWTNAKEIKGRANIKNWAIFNNNVLCEACTNERMGNHKDNQI